MVSYVPYCSRNSAYLAIPSELHDPKIDSLFRQIRSISSFTPGVNRTDSTERTSEGADVVLIACFSLSALRESADAERKPPRSKRTVDTIFCDKLVVDFSR